MDTEFQPPQQGQSAPGEAARQLAEAFTQAVRDMTAATEKFTLDAMREIGSAVQRAELAASTTSELVASARNASREAEEAAANVRSALAGAEERLTGQAAEVIAGAITGVEERLRAQATDAVEQASADVSARLENALKRLDEATVTNNDSLATIRSATEQARLASERVTTSAGETESAINEARQAAGEAAEAARRSERAASSVTQAAAAAMDSAELARQSAARAEQAGHGSFANEAGLLLERLETDYTLLTRLVQELNLRITGLTGAGSLAPAPAYEQLPDPPAGAGWTANWDDEPAIPSEPGEPATSDALRPANDDPAPESQAASGVASQPAVVLSGRIQVMLSPVPDFDRLLNLDGALATIQGVHHVTLADYAREEVTFRVELAAPLTADDFARRLSAVTGEPATIEHLTNSSVGIRLG